VDVSFLESDVHAGTHVDAPLHHIEDGDPIDALPLSTLVGPAFVALIDDSEAVTSDVLEAAGVPPGTSRLLVRTRNSEPTRESQPFDPTFAALTPDAAQWVVAAGIRLVGIDGPSIQRFHDGPDVHTILLEEGVIVVEGLALGHILPGVYELTCLPLRLAGAEGAPARVILRRRPGEGR
jgi:arylformamidase